MLGIYAMVEEWTALFTPENSTWVFGSNGAENRSKEPNGFLTLNFHDPRSAAC